MDSNQHMKHALSLALGGLGTVSPNPLVGCVVVKNGIVIGKGFHKKHSAIHAEVAALDSCTVSPKTGHLFCNLEPCGRMYTGKKHTPCTKRIIREGIHEVSISTLDPNPQLKGYGVATLRKAGIKVNIGIEADQAIKLNLPFFTNMHLSRPFIHLKSAQSLDGQIATQTGNSKWITDRFARKIVHQLRSNHDAILIGKGTAIYDNPNLTVRLRHVKEDQSESRITPLQPWRIIIDKNLQTPKSTNLISDRYAKKTIILTSKSNDDSQAISLRELGVKVISITSCKGMRINLYEAMNALYRFGIRSILVEGGKGIFTSFLNENLFDQFTTFIAPLIIGSGINLVGDLDIKLVSEAIKLQSVNITKIHNQVMISGYRNINSIKKLVFPSYDKVKR